MDFFTSPALLLAASDETARIAFAMMVVFTSAKLLAEVFERLHQPGIVGEILAGVLIGPGVLGWIHPNEFLAALSELGVMFLLFRVGLEVKSSELMKVGGTATLVAVLGVVLPFGAGWAILRLWGAPHVESIFVGAALVATSVGITAQVLAEKGLLDLRASRIILAAAIIDDVLGLIVLAIVSSVARGKVNVVELALTSALAIGFTAFVATLGTRAMNRLVPRLEAGLRASQAQFHIAITLMFALALLAMHAGVAAIIGAFLAGMALSETTGERVHRLVDGVTELLVPFFLAGIGLHLDLKAFLNGPTLVLSLAVLLAAVFTKLVGCGAGALKLGRSEAFRVGVGMVPRGEVGMVVAQIGQNLGVIPNPVYAVVVFMAVLTTLAAPPLLRIAYRDAAGNGATG
jgi:Kef-type K+ transport system membrane component KefB